MVVYSCQSEGDIEFGRYYTDGAIVYQSHCQNCHGSKGEGLGDLIPPLTDSAYLKARKNDLACGIKNGILGQINVSGKLYDDQMPANDISPIEIAQALTYIGNSFGNKLGLINGDEVNGDLEKCIILR
jgi:mono/diheme cytochrome c family protein